MKFFILSDSHFLHDNIIKYCNRPSNFNEQIIRNWRRVVSDEDIVIHLGDVACGFKGNEEKLKQIFDLLPGKKYLIRGNHDTRPDEFYKNLGFEDIRDYLIIENNGLKTLLCHYPLEISLYDSIATRDFQTELMSLFRDKECSFLIHGHTHNAKPRYAFAFNASVERLNYTPIELQKCFEGLKSFQETLHIKYAKKV